MDSMYKGVDKVTGEFAEVVENDDRRPFKAVLDVGLANTTIGNKVFSALKGACDGGLLIPHSEKRFPGYSKGDEGDKGNYDAEIHRKRIFGAHVDTYIAELKKEDAEAYKK